MRKRVSMLALLALGTACRKGDLAPFDTDTDPTADTDTDPGVPTVPPGPEGPLGWIGSPCETAADCPFEGSQCLSPSEGYGAGMCTQPCDRVCPDAPDTPVTFCVDEAALPAAAPDFADGGACHTRCDFGFFPDTGCRPGYGCSRVPRGNEPDTELYACLPGEGDVLPDCYYQLADAGVRFEPTVVEDRSPPDFPGLVCHVEDPIVIRPPMHGVDIVTTSGQSVGLTGACELGRSLSDTVLDVQARGATRVFHLGTYVCRTIAGTSTLSRHASGDAIDIWGFGFADGSVYSLIDDWEHDTPAPVDPAAAWLYDAAYRWYDAQYWNIILTPNYNAAHDNHFHVDLTPGSHTIGSADDGRYIGPAPYAD